MFRLSGVAVSAPLSGATMEQGKGILGLTFIVALMAVTVGVYPRHARATPETWIVPSLSFEGAAANDRFGDAIACSAATLFTNNRSFVAVGAPQASGGDGAVYLFDPSRNTSPSTPYQTILPPTPGQGGNFGASIAFVHDIPGGLGTTDDRDDLVIGEPGTGTIYIYESTLVGDRIEYVLCPSSPLSRPTNFGAKMLGIRGPWAQPTPAAWEHIVVSSPDNAIANERGVVGIDLSTACASTSTINSRFVSLNNTVSYGRSLAEISGQALGDPGETAQRSDILVSQPDFVIGGAGRVQLLDSYELTLTPEFTVSQLSEELYGQAIAGYHGSTTFAIASPNRNGGQGAVDIHEALNSPTCSVAQTSGESPVNFGLALTHLDRNFTTLFSGNSDATFASYRSESSTGGSVALFSIYTGACSSLYQVNNCIADASQEQGRTLEGGNECIIRPNGGAAKKMLLIGSPGWSSQKGRVDIVAAGDELGSPQSCGALATSTPTPTSTPQESPGQPDPTPTPQPTPVPVQPGSAVPPVTVEIAGSTVVFVIPEVQATLSTAQRNKALKTLAKRGIKGAKAEKALNTLTLMFEITLVSTSSKKSITLQSSSDLIPFASSSKKRQYKSRLNRVSAPKLPPGNYTVTWKATIYTKKPSIAIGATKTSPPTKFTK
jgi:hypothetical protein